MACRSVRHADLSPQWRVPKKICFFESTKKQDPRAQAARAKGKAHSECRTCAQT